ncbi:MAG: DUF1134 domain-containing protein [Candidatus Dadabacteria bacterium]
MRIPKTLIFAAAIFLAYAGSALADEVPSGTISIDETQFGLIIGGSEGSGILNYQGAEYIFKTSGIKVGGVGVAKISAAGEVYNLFNLGQFPGTYVAGDYGIALGGGAGGVVLKNENGVLLKLHSTMEGVDLNVGISGVTIKLEAAVPPADED